MNAEMNAEMGPAAEWMSAELSRVRDRGDDHSADLPRPSNHKIDHVGRRVVGGSTKRTDRGNEVHSQGGEGHARRFLVQFAEAVARAREERRENHPQQELAYGVHPLPRDMAEIWPRYSRDLAEMRGSWESCGSMRLARSRLYLGHISARAWSSVVPSWAARAMAMASSCTAVAAIPM